MDTKNKMPEGFAAPTALPDQQLQTNWQEKNRSWWEDNPMRYDWNEKVRAEEFSAPFYKEIDKRFFSDAARYTPPVDRPFDEFVPFDRLPSWDVLEIGVGNGSHAMLLAPHCKSYTGIDLTGYAVKSTSKRFEVFGLKGAIRQMDAEKLEFLDGSFDYVWSWGVIHHSANTGQILAEINRVLRPGGRATIMVYHRSFLYFEIFTGLFRGILCGGFLKARSLHQLVQFHTDGAIARFYRPSEWHALVEHHGFVIDNEWVKGQVSELLPIPVSRFKEALMNASWMHRIARFILGHCRQGSFLITTIRKA